MLSSKDFPSNNMPKDPMDMTSSDMKYLENRDDFVETGS